LQSDLRAHGVHCDVVGSSSIPSPRGEAVKPDRIDAGYLAHYYANDLLTIVQPPDAEQEQDRDLLRTRQKLLQQRTQLPSHLQALLPCQIDQLQGP
jgi:transposase